MKDREVSRRTFLQNAVLTAGAGTMAAGITHPLSGQVRTIENPTQGKAKIGIIGSWGRGKDHVKVMNRLNDQCEVPAICDISDDSIQKALKELTNNDPKVYKDYRNMLEHPGLTAVIIATPNYLHSEMAIAALNKGCHVLVEKPMACTTADCKKMIQVMRRSRRILMAGFQMPYRGVWRRLFDVILKENRIGDVKIIQGIHLRGDWRALSDDPDINNKINWRFFQDLSGGSIVEKVCHDFDIYNLIASSKPVRVFATGGNHVYTSRETIDHAIISIDYENGVKVGLTMNFYSPSDHPLRIIGEKGIVQLDRNYGRSVEVKLLDGPETVLDEYPFERYINKGGTLRLDQEFLSAMREGRPPWTDAYRGLRAVAMAEAAEISIREQRIVYMNELLS